MRPRLLAIWVLFVVLALGLVAVSGVVYARHQLGEIEENLQHAEATLLVPIEFPAWSDATDADLVPDEDAAAEKLQLSDDALFAYISTASNLRESTITPEQARSIHDRLARYAQAHDAECLQRSVELLRFRQAYDVVSTDELDFEAPVIHRLFRCARRATEAERSHAKQLLEAIAVAGGNRQSIRADIAAVRLDIEQMREEIRPWTWLEADYRRALTTADRFVSSIATPRTQRSEFRIVAIAGALEPPAEQEPRDDSDREQTRLVIVSAGRYYRACYELELYDNPSLGGRTQMRLTVSPEGDVSHVRVVSGIGTPEMQTCLIEAMEDLHFAPQPTLQIVNYPLVFQSTI